MTVVTFEQLQLNLAAFGVENGVMKVTFRCPVTGRSVDASAPVTAPESPHDVAQLWQAARRGATRLIGNILGGKKPDTLHQDTDKRAIVAAFESVRNAFHWDAKRGHFVSAAQSDALMNPFDTLLQAAPLLRPADRDIAARVVWDIIRADGEIHPAEEKFVESVLGKKVAAMRNTPEVSRLDIEHLAAPSRGTVLMLALATALSDERRHTREAARIARLTQQLGVNPEREALFHDAAAQKVIENVLLECYSDGVMDDAERARVTLLAQRLGVNEALVAKVDVRLRQRRAHG